MKFKRNLLTLCVAAGVAAFPAFAAPVAAHTTLSRIDLQAKSMERTAGRMNSYTSDQLDWMAQGLQLTRLKGQINTLGREVRNLQMENSLSPDQQARVDRMAQRINMMASATQDAILYGRTHRDLLWQPGYERDVRVLYQDAQRLAHEAHVAARS